MLTLLKSKETFRRSGETLSEYRVRLEGICRERYRLRDHSLEGYRIPQPIASDEEENVRTRTAEEQASDGKDDPIRRPTDSHDSSLPESWFSKLGGLMKGVGALTQAARPSMPVGARMLVVP